jgi:hypothetical protein
MRSLWEIMTGNFNDEGSDIFGVLVILTLIAVAIEIVVVYIRGRIRKWRSNGTT